MVEKYFKNIFYVEKVKNANFPTLSVVNTDIFSTENLFLWSVATYINFIIKGGVHGSAHVHESKHFFAFARDDPSLFNLIRCL